MAAKKSTRSRTAQGNGSVYQDKKHGTWIAQISDGVKENGKPKYLRVRCKTEKLATAQKNAMLAKQAQGKAVITTSLTVGAWLDTWLDQYVKPNSKPLTYKFYNGYVKNWIKPNLGKIALNKLKPTEIDNLITRAKAGDPTLKGNPLSPRQKGKPLATGTVRGIRITLGTACKVAVSKGLLGDNPVLRSASPKMEQPEVGHLTAAQAAKLLERCVDPSTEFGNLILVGLMTGLRISEVLGLTWDKVDLDAKTLKVHSQLQRIDKEFVLSDLKTGSKAKRTLALPDAAVVALTREKEKHQSTAHLDSALPTLGDILVFKSEAGKPLHAWAINRELSRLCRSAGIQQISFHKLRHTVATCMAEAGVNLDIIRDQLGHSTIAITMNTYRHFVPAKQKEAVNLLAGLYETAADRQREAE